MSKRRSGKQPVYRITDARRSLTDDVRSREIRYIISMGIRTVCFLLAIIVSYWPLRIAFFVGALVLPYFAVVLANAGREQAGTIMVEPVEPADRLALEDRKPAEDS